MSPDGTSTQNDRYRQACQEHLARREQGVVPTREASEDVHRQLLGAILQAARTEVDLGDVLAEALVDAAEELGHVMEVVRGRPGSWEAGIIIGLVQRTVGYHEPITEGLPDYF